MNRIEELFELQRDGRLDEASMSELVRLLDDPVQRRLWWRMSTWEGAMREVLTPPRQRTSGPRKVPKSHRRAAVRSASRPWVAVTVAAIVLVAALVGLRLWQGQQGATDQSAITAVATVTEAGAGARLGDQPLVAGSRLAAGAQVHGPCSIALPDGTTLRLAPDGHLTVAVNPGVAAHVNGGQLTVEAAKQIPGSPLVVTTPFADVSVLGTRFTISVEDQRSTVQVDHGRVRVAAPGRDPVEIGAGEFAEATQGNPIRRWQPPATAWREELAGRAAALIAKGWVGVARPDGLASQDAGPASNGTQMYWVCTPERMQAPGFARVQNDMALRLTLSLERPATLLVQLQVGTPGPDSSWLGNYQTEVRLEACTREPVIIPWGDFKGGTSQRPKNELPPACVYRILVMQAVEERGLVIHRMALDQGTPTP